MGEDEKEKTSGLGQKIGNEAKQQVSNQAKKGAQKLGKKVMSKFSKEGAKKIGASAAKKAAMSGPMMVLMLKILLVILIIIAIIGIVMFLVTMPGMVMDKLKALAKTVGNAIASWFGADTTKQIDDEEIYQILDYLEQMGYDLQGEGFLTKIFTMDNINEWLVDEWKDEDGEDAYKAALPGEIDEVIALLNDASQSPEKDSLVQSLEALKNDNSDIATKINELKASFENITDISDESKRTEILNKIEDLKPIDREITNIKLENGTVRDKTEGNIIGAESLFIYNYLISDNYVYTVKNFNLVTEGKDGYKWWSPFAALGARFMNLFGNSGSEIWGQGLISIYHEVDGRIGTRGEFYGNGPFGFNDISLDAEARTLSIRRGWGENKMVYSLDGWTGRYGMPLEFLLSVHLATKMPDLAYDMTQIFGTGDKDGVSATVQAEDGSSVEIKPEGTEIEILLHPLDNVNAETAYEKDASGSVETENSKYITYAEMKTIKGEGWSPTDGWTLSREEAFEIMKMGIKSPENCTFTAPTYKIETATDNGDGWIFDPNHYSNLKTSYGGSYEELEELGDDLAEISIEAQAEAFKISEAMVQTTDESAEYTPSKYSEATGFGYSESTAEIESEPYEIQGRETIIGSCTCSETSHKTQSESGYVTCYTHAVYGYQTYSPRYCKPNTYYEIERTITNRYWNQEYNGEETEYTWVTYRYRVYSYTNSARTEGKTYITSYFIDYILRNKTTEEMIADGILNPDGSLKEDGLCSDAASGNSGNITQCCENCRKYIKKIMKLMKEGNDPDFNTYTPYISRVTGHWYRDVYFVLQENELLSPDGKTIYNTEFVQVDEEYEAVMGERWTLYETDDQGQYVLYKVNEDGSLGEVYNGTQQQANEEGVKVSKKASTVKLTDVDEDGDPLIHWEEGDFGTWSAYREDPNERITGWERLYADAEEGPDDKIYVRIKSTGDVLQVEEGQRTETNPFIKKLFLNNRYFKYDGSQRTAEIIEALRKQMSPDEENLKMGALTDSELSTSVTIDGETYTAEEYSGTVELTQNSLSAFSMLENTHTMDADFIYRDFKELVVELGYFTKEELTDETPEIFQWFIPEIGSYGYPIASLDKKENEFGTLAHSKEDYESNEKNTLAARYAEVQAEIAAGEAEESEVGNGAIGSEVSGMSLDSTANVNTQVSSIDTYQTVNVEEIVGAMGSNFERKVEEGDGYEYKVIVDGSVEYTHYYQFEGSYKDNPFWGGTISECGCGPTSCCNLLTGYGVDVTPADTASFLGTLNTNADLVRVMGNWGVSSQWIDGKSEDEYKTLMEQAFSEGKPVIILMQASKGGDDFWTTGGHFVAVAGVDSNGNMITIDTGSKRAERHTYTPGIAGAVEYMSGILIPDEAPTGAKAGGVYEGYEGGEAVVSPVTGILLEYGTYDENSKDPLSGEEPRVNVDFKYMEGTEGEGGDSEGTIPPTGDSTGEPEGGEPSQIQEEVKDKVGYAKILVLDDETYLEIEDHFRTSGSDALEEMDQNTLIDESGNYLDNKELKVEEGIKDWSDEAKTLYGYKEFAELYSDFGVSGYIVYIDGFKTELPAEDSSEDDDSGEISLGNGTILDLDYFKNDSEEYETLYKKEPRYNLSSKDATYKLNHENELKDVADPVMTIGDKVIIKEGTVLGRTMSNKELVEARGETYIEPSEIEDLLDSETENTAQVQGNYIRIFMIDEERELVENVEEYLKLDENGVASASQEYVAQEGDLQLLANLLHHEGCENFFASAVFNGDHTQGAAASRVTGYVLINRALLNYGGHGTTIREQILAPGQYSTAYDVTEGEAVFCEECLANAEWCLTYDCSSVTNPSGEPMPRNVLGQSGWCQTCTPKFSCWWWVDTNGDGQHTEYSGPGSPFDTFFCINSNF